MLARKLKKAFCEKKNVADCELLSSQKIKEELESTFIHKDCVIFIGALGIAVRMVAPYLRGKEMDPALLVMDEKAEHVISVLSGHLGHANEYAKMVAKWMQAEPVITTATDLNKKFAVDLFAEKNELRILTISMIKEVSARILAGEQIPFFSELPIKGDIPNEVFVCSKEQMLKTDAEFRETCGIYLAKNEPKKPWKKTCQLVPKDLIVGIGCRKGKHIDEIRAAWTKTCQENRLCEKRLAGVCSIDVKAQEEGLILFARENKVSFFTYSAEELKNLHGPFSTSDFVEKQVGVDNVCERSAVMGSGNTKLLVKKTICDGITIAIGIKERGDKEICLA